MRFFTTLLFLVFASSAFGQSPVINGSLNGSGAYVPNGSCSTCIPLSVLDSSVLAAVQAAVPSGANIIGKVGIDQTTPGTTNGIQVLPGTAASGTDPCLSAVKLKASFSSTTPGGSIVTAVAAKKIYVCAVVLVTSAAATVSFIEGTGSSVCTGGTIAGAWLNPSNTAASGTILPAGAIVSAGNGNGTIFATSNVNQNLCVTFTTGNVPSVGSSISYVQQP